MSKGYLSREVELPQLGRIEIREIGQGGLEALQELVLKTWRNVLYTDPTLKNDKFWLPGIADSEPEDGHGCMVIVALGEPDEKPYMNLGKHGIVGYFGTRFFTGDRIKGLRPWHNHNLKPATAQGGRLYAVPAHRKKGVGAAMMQTMERVFRYHGYGNIEEIIDDDFLKASLQKNGFSTKDGRYFGKLLPDFADFTVVTQDIAEKKKVETQLTEYKPTERERQLLEYLSLPHF